MACKKVITKNGVKIRKFSKILKRPNQPTPLFDTENPPEKRFPGALFVSQHHVPWFSSWRHLFSHSFRPNLPHTALHFPIHFDLAGENCASARELSSGAPSRVLGIPPGPLKKTSPFPLRSPEVRFFPRDGCCTGMLFLWKFHLIPLHTHFWVKIPLSNSYSPGFA